MRPRTDSDVLLRGRQLGDFVLCECIGEGAFAAVYRCEQPLLGREAVIKVLHQRMRGSEVVFQRFMREARLASRLDHPYAAHIYAFGVEPDDGLAWIAMEFVHGTSLERWLAERGPLPLDVLVGFFEHVAEIVQNAHDHGIVHRDLKPSNVMVLEYAGKIFPKLLDFGIAKLVDNTPGMPEAPTLDDGGPLPEDSDDIHLTQANATLGSPPYMSPEQWCDPLSVGPRSDLYSLGIMAYEALTGRQPFVGPTIPAIGEQHCNAPVPSVGAGFPATLDHVFQRALAKLPKDRPVSAIAFAAELRAAACGRIRGSESSIPTETMAPIRQRRLWPVAVGAGALVFSGVAAYLFAAGGRDERALALPPASITRTVESPASPPAGARAAPGGPVLTVAAPSAAAPATVIVEIESIPGGADVYRLPSETKVGSTPWRAELATEPGKQLFLVKKSGFAERTVEVDLHTAGTRNVKIPLKTFRRAGAPVPTPAAKPATAPARRKGDPVDPFQTSGAS